MMTLSNKSGQMEKGQKSARKRICSQFLGLVGLGTMILAVCSLFLGCGSDSKPGKNEQAAASTEAKKATPGRLLGIDQKVAPGDEKMGQAKKMPESRRMEPFGGMSPMELEDKAAQSRAEVKKAQEKSIAPVLGGMTQKELEAKVEESRKNIKTKGGGEIFPGITVEELERMAAQGQKREPRPVQEMFPGATKKQVDASSRTRQPSFREMFPPASGK